MAARLLSAHDTSNRVPGTAWDPDRLLDTIGAIQSTVRYEAKARHLAPTSSPLMQSTEEGRCRAVPEKSLISSVRGHSFKLAVSQSSAWSEGSGFFLYTVSREAAPEESARRLQRKPQHSSETKQGLGLGPSNPPAHETAAHVN